MKAYAYNTAGEFIGEVDCQPNPLEFGEWIVPAWATTTEPPKPKTGNVRVWTGSKWIFEPIPSTETQSAE